MKKLQTNKLMLHRETLATLTALDQVAGGSLIARSSACLTALTCFVTCGTGTLEIHVCVPQTTFF